MLLLDPDKDVREQALKIKNLKRKDRPEDDDIVKRMKQLNIKDEMEM